MMFEWASGGFWFSIINPQTNTFPNPIFKKRFSRILFIVPVSLYAHLMLVSWSSWNFTAIWICRQLENYIDSLNRIYLWGKMFVHSMKKSTDKGIGGGGKDDQETIFWLSWDHLNGFISIHLNWGIIFRMILKDY